MRPLLAVVIVTLALVPSASAALPDPCTLLTTAQVAKALGSPTDHRTPGGDGRYRTCVWQGAPVADSVFSQPQLALQVARTTKAAFEKQRRRMPGTSTVAGLGDAAYWHRTPTEFLVVRRDGLALTVTVAQVMAPLEQAKRVARLVLARL